MMKRMLSVGVMALTLMTTCVPTFAADGNVGVSAFKPGDGTSIETRTTDKPKNSEVYDLSVEKKYEFNGRAAYDSLYTDYNFTGCTAYDIQVSNAKGTNEDPLSVLVYKNPAIGTDKKLKSVTVNGRQTKDFSVSGLNKTDKIFIEFEAPSHFSGWIDEG